MRTNRSNATLSLFTADYSAPAVALSRTITTACGREVRLDAADHARLSGYRWRFDPHTGYARRYCAERKRDVWLHRELMGEPADMVVDHRSGDRLDNRRANLRLATAQENARNRASSRSARSAYLGVSPVAGDRWRADIHVDGTTIYLGRYATEIGAALAYDAAARERFGAFARLNFPAPIDATVAA